MHAKQIKRGIAITTVITQDQCCGCFCGFIMWLFAACVKNLSYAAENGKCEIILTFFVQKRYGR